MTSATLASCWPVTDMQSSTTKLYGQYLANINPVLVIFDPDVVLHTLLIGRIILCQSNTGILDGHPVLPSSMQPLHKILHFWNREPHCKATRQL